MAMKKTRNYLICILLILAIAFYMSWKNGLFSTAAAPEVFRILSDSFFVPGFLFLGYGAMSWASTKGTYDMLSFGCGRVARNFVPSMDKHKYDDFYKYKQARDEKGRVWRPHILICGLGTVCLAAGFMLLYFAV